MIDALWVAAISISTIVGSLIILSVAIRQFTTRDAVARVNAIGPATTPGIPLIAFGALLGWFWQVGFSWVLFIKIVVTILASVFITSVGTSVLARAAYMSGAPLDPLTSPNHLADEPDDVSHARQATPEDGERGRLEP